MKSNHEGRGAQLRTAKSSGQQDPLETHSVHSASAPQLRKILVPVDFSEQSFGALEFAIVMAKRFHAELILLHVVEPVVTQDQRLRALPENSEVLLEEARERLQELKNTSVGANCRAEILVRIGHAHSEISDTANALGADLIVISGHSNNELKNSTLGSTAEKVVRQAVCAVLVLKQ